MTHTPFVSNPCPTTAIVFVSQNLFYGQLPQSAPLFFYTFWSRTSLRASQARGACCDTRSVRGVFLTRMSPENDLNLVSHLRARNAGGRIRASAAKTISFISRLRARKGWTRASVLRDRFLFGFAPAGAKGDAAKFFRKWELFLQRSRPKEYNAQGGTTT